ncbi:glutathione synthase [Brevundimonas terrae]|uniref:Glutathione synthetase n=1 Tax=Brevundimonas terrae TaxID=363631 RepID=A0ABN0YJU4_9CAUL|nr:glutathione synthetase [Brevundimonas terrae]NIJ27487.1 glutathione synthase [Brevundimonas terrae]
MRIAFFVNSIEGETPRYTTTILALAAMNRGHEICYVTPSDFVLSPDDNLSLSGLELPSGNYKKPETFHRALQSSEATKRLFDMSEIDVLFLRNDPSLDAIDRPWAANVGIIFGRMAAQRGVLVVNDPDGLAQAQNKLYFQDFPSSVRPLTLISKNIDEIRSFIQGQKKGVIIKPLQGSGGKNVFKISSPKDHNLNQIFEAVSEEGYLIAQAFIPEAGEGDVRFFLMNGRPLVRDGKYAAFRRVPAKGEIRSNIHVGGGPAPVEVSATMLEIAETVRPKLIQDGMFLVGLDIVGDKLLEINVFTPGGINNLSLLYDTHFADSIIEALEKKKTISTSYGHQISNRELATL